MKKRKLEKDLVFTIDPIGCEDKDDAISISKDYNKDTKTTEYILKVHIEIYQNLFLIIYIKKQKKE